MMHISLRQPSSTATVMNCPYNESEQIICPIPEQPHPPLCLTEGRSSQPKVMSETQRQFAAERHNLIYTFLREKGWAPGEYYDIAAFGFLRAVMRYLSEPNLHQYAFSTIAWRAMGQSIASYHRAESRRVESEQRYLETKLHQEQDPFTELEANLLLHDLFARSSSEQYRLAALRLQGYSIAETARTQGMTPKRVRRLLRELYHVYLQLYTK